MPSVVYRIALLFPLGLLVLEFMLGKKKHRCVGIGRQFPLRMEWLQPYKFESCYLYMENLKWIKLNKQGFIADKYKNISSNYAGIYAYRLILDKTKVYIGSEKNLSQRFTV